jgi:hypothetical protein
VLLAFPAHADDESSIVGEYRVKFEEVQNSCSSTGMTLDKSTVEITAGKRKRIDVTIPMVPLMKGVASKGGKFKAKARLGATAIQGVKGKFSASGRVSDDVIQMVFIAEYFRGDNPLCTQSWNASGVKKVKK